MKRLLIFALSLLWLQSISQPSLDSTTTWTYSYNNFGIVEANSLFINGDTIINGISWLMLDGDKSCSFSNPDFLPLIRETNRKWMLYDVNSGEESVLYDFNLIAGDSYIIEIFGPNFSIEVNIDSTSNRMINGTQRTVQHIQVIDFGVEIIEGVGCTTYLFPQGNICDPHTGPIRCFQNNIELVDFDLERDCDETHLTNNTNQILNESELTIYPNPSKTNNQVFIHTNFKIEKIEVINQLGKKIKTLPNELNLRFEETGLYYLRIGAGGKSTVKKVLITNE